MQKQCYTVLSTVIKSVEIQRALNSIINNILPQQPL
jgi:hypothetical protein